MKNNHEWIDKFQKDVFAAGFKVVEKADDGISMLIAQNDKFIIRIFERPNYPNFKYTADIGVAKNFDRWANSTDWFVLTFKPFSLQALMKVVNDFYTKKYYDPDCSDYLDISGQVRIAQELMAVRYCLDCLPDKVVMNKKGNKYTCPICKKHIVDAISLNNP